MEYDLRFFFFNSFGIFPGNYFSLLLQFLSCLTLSDKLADYFPILIR